MERLRPWGVIAALKNSQGTISHCSEENFTREINGLAGDGCFDGCFLWQTRPNLGTPLPFCPGENGISWMYPRHAWCVLSSRVRSCPPCRVTESVERLLCTLCVHGLTTGVDKEPSVATGLRSATGAVLTCRFGWFRPRINFYFPNAKLAVSKSFMSSHPRRTLALVSVHAVISAPVWTCSCVCCLPHS